MIAVLLAALLFALDYGVKTYVDTHREEKEETPVLKNKLIIRKYYNHGLAMNKLEDRPKIVKLLSATAFGFFLGTYLPMMLEKGKKLKKIGAALVIGGAMGNLYDHFFRGKVIDFVSINCKWEKVKKVVFNLADLFVAVGGIILLLCECAETISKKKGK